MMKLDILGSWDNLQFSNDWNVYCGGNDGGGDTHFCPEVTQYETIYISFGYEFVHNVSFQFRDSFRLTLRFFETVTQEELF